MTKFIIQRLKPGRQMRLSFLPLILLFLLFHLFQCHDHESHDLNIEISTEDHRVAGARTEMGLPSEQINDQNFKQIMDYYYDRAVNGRKKRDISATASPTASPASTQCQEDETDLCHFADGNCTACLAIQGCGYCNDYMQCLPSAGDSPKTPNCQCEIWMTEPKHCIEGVCAEISGCSECSNRPYCVWCPNEQLCLPGGFFGKAPEVGEDCKDWRWMRCSGILGITSVIIASTFFAIFIVSFVVGCTLYQKCFASGHHNHHLSHEELVGNLLEDERNILSGTYLTGQFNIVPELDLQGDNKILNTTIAETQVDAPIELEDKGLISAIEDMPPSSSDEDEEQLPPI